MQKAGYRVIVKFFLTIFMTIGCNLMMGEPWREDIFPYVFLILAGAALFSMDDEKLSVWARENKRKALLLLAASFLIQCALRRPDQAESLMVFIKICVKMLICSITLFVILLLCMIRLLKERKLPGKIFYLFSMITIPYFYVIRGGYEFNIYPLILILLLYLAEGGDKAEKREKKIKFVGAVFFACCETLGYMAVNSWNFHGDFWQWLCLAAVGIIIWGFVFYYVLTDVLMLLDWQTGRGTVGGKWLSGKAKMMMFAVMVGVRFLFWLNWFPGFLSKDTFGQIQQAVGDIAYSNHHSWLHTMIIKAFLSGGGISASDSVDVFYRYDTFFCSSVMDFVLLL